MVSKSFKQLGKQQDSSNLMIVDSSNLMIFYLYFIQLVIKKLSKYLSLKITTLVTIF